MKKILILLIISLLLVNFASAEPLEITYKGISDAVQAGGTALFELTLKNLENTGDNYQIVPSTLALDPASQFESVISSPGQLFIAGKGSAKVNLSIKTKEKIAHGRFYETQIIIRSINNPSKQQTYQINIHILSPDDIVRLTPIVPSRATPGEEFNVAVKLENMINQPLHNINFYITSEIFEEKRVLEFFPYQERTETLTFRIPTSTKPQDYKLSVRAYQGEWLNAKRELSFKVLVNSDIHEKVEVIKGFLVKKTIITKTNVGNAIAEDTYVTSFSPIERLFTFFSVDPTSKGKEGYTWSFSLNPEQEYVIIARTDYRPLFWALVIIVLSLATAYYWISRSVLVRKQVFKLKQTEEGMTQLKILLHIANRTGKPIRHLTLTEILPAMIHPSPKFGTLKPDKIQPGITGTRLIWEIPELVKGEERVLSYEVTSKMGIVGKFMLPAALLRYKNVRNRTVNVRSNRLTLLPGFEA